MTLCIILIACLLGLLLSNMVIDVNQGGWKRRFFHLLFMIVVSYFIMVSCIYAYELHLGGLLSAFDLNADGIFSGEEISQEQEVAMQKVTSDAGRGLVKLFGVMIAIFVYLVWWFASKVVAIAVRRKP